MRILLVEDEPRLSELLAAGLRKRGMAVDVAADGQAALAKAELNPYDAIVLDRGLPALSGDQVLERLRASGSQTRILLLTALSAPSDRVAGFELGADDYLVKPFHFEELVLRLRALERRPIRAQATVFERAGIRLDPARREASRDGRVLDLTAKEHAVLEELLKAEGAVVSSEDLLERAWDENADPFTNAVRVTVMRLRRKLGEPSPIRTHPGAGYSIP
jgi:two-component system, OmpR family, response regulator VanR